jgi:hypothetical protein
MLRTAAGGALSRANPGVDQDRDHAVATAARRIAPFRRTDGRICVDQGDNAGHAHSV